MPTQAKKELVAELKERFSGASNIFITDYMGLTVEQITRLRRDFRQQGIDYIVAKNTLMRMAAKESGLEGLDEFLKGPTAVAFSKAEPNIPAKVLYDFVKEFKEISKPQVKVFYIDREQYAASDVQRMAELPSRTVLLSQLVTAVEGPIAGLIGTLDGIIRELVGTIDAMARERNE